MKAQGTCLWKPAIVALLIGMSMALSGQAETITVNSLNDSEGGATEITLRKAINTANAMSTDVTITFGSLGGTLVLASDLPAIKRSMVIYGSGKSNLTIHGAYKYRVFSILDGNVSISDLTISSAYAKGGNGGSYFATAGGGGGGGGMGAALFVYKGTVNCSNVDFANNKVQGGNGGVSGYNDPDHFVGGSGGGGFAGDGGTFVGMSGGSGGSGGVLGNDGAGGYSAGFQYAAGAGKFGGGGGGGIDSAPNSSYYNGGSGGFGGGGGGASQGGACGQGGSFGGAASSHNGGGGAGLGGAVFVRENATLLLQYCNFTSNQALRGTGSTNGQGKGGAIFAMTGARVKVYWLSFSGNAADDAKNTGDVLLNTPLDTPDVWGLLKDVNDTTAFPPSEAVNWSLYR